MMLTMSVRTRPMMSAITPKIMPPRAQRPPQQAGHREQSTPLANVGRRRRATQNLGDRRFEHQREQIEIGRIEGPARPDHKEYKPLVARNAEQTLPRRNIHRLAHVLLAHVLLPGARGILSGANTPLLYC